VTRARTYGETVVLGIVALAAFSFAISTHGIQLLNAIHASQLWNRADSTLRLISAIYGFGFLLASGLSLRAAKAGNRNGFPLLSSTAETLLTEARETARWFVEEARVKGTWTWIVAVIGIGCTVRGYFLAQPMRYDEAFTFLTFVNHGFLQLFYYPVPNNHVLHTLLVGLSTEVLGSNPVAIRLPAAFAGVLTILMTFWTARLFSGKESGGFGAAALVAVYPYLILFDTMARGYSIYVFLTVCLVGLGFRLIDKPSPGLCGLMSLVTALGLFDIPTFLFPAAGVFLWVACMLLVRGHSPVWVLVNVLVPSALMTALMAGVFYTPVVIVNNGLERVVSNRFVAGLPWNEFLSQLPSHIASVPKEFTRNVPSPGPQILLLLTIVGLATFAWKRDWTGLTLLPILLIGASVPLLLAHAIPFGRTWIYLLPVSFIAIDTGFRTLARVPDTYVMSVLLVGAAVCGIAIMGSDTVSKTPATGYFPQAPALVSVLADQMTPADSVVAATPANATIDFYMWYLGVPGQDSASEEHGAPKEFFVVKPSHYSLADLTDKPARLLVRLGDAELWVADDLDAP
jgi:hypothetical protein